MKKICLPLAVVVSIGSALAETFVLFPACIQIDKPSDWTITPRNTYSASNVCFPKLVKDDTVIDAVIWKADVSVDIALSRYIKRLPRLIRQDESFQEISRSDFSTDWGVSGIKFIFETTRQTDCGPKSFKFVRYIFRDSKSQIVCLGGTGDLSTIDKIVTSSLKLTSAQQGAAANP